MMNILIIDNHQSLRTTLQKILEKEHDIHVLGTVSKSESQSALLKWEDEVDIILMDVNLGMGEPDGLLYARDLKTSYPFLKIMMYSFHKVGAYIYYLYRLGIDGYVFKDSDISDLLMGLRRINSGHNYYEGAVRERMDNYMIHLHAKSDREIFITDQEKAFLEMMYAGNSPEEIISLKGANPIRMITHWSNITLKFGTHNTNEILQTSQEKGWVK